MFQADKINAEERSEKPPGEMDASAGLGEHARAKELPRAGAAPTACCTDVGRLQSLTSPPRSLSLLRSGHLTLDVKARREFPSIVSCFRSSDQIKALIWKRASLMMQHVPTVSKGRLGQVDSKMDEHVQGEKNGRWG